MAQQDALTHDSGTQSFTFEDGVNGDGWHDAWTNDSDFPIEVTLANGSPGGTLVLGISLVVATTGSTITAGSHPFTQTLHASEAIAYAPQKLVVLPGFTLFAKRANSQTGIGMAVTARRCSR